MAAFHGDVAVDGTKKQVSVVKVALAMILI
jgi:hypothetical protein